MPPGGDLDAYGVDSFVTSETKMSSIGSRMMSEGNVNFCVLNEVPNNGVEWDPTDTNKVA